MSARPHIAAAITLVFLLGARCSPKKSTELRAYETAHKGMVALFGRRAKISGPTDDGTVIRQVAPNEWDVAMRVDTDNSRMRRFHAVFHTVLQDPGKGEMIFKRTYTTPRL